jgi:hypothetical protein
LEAKTNDDVRDSLKAAGFREVPLCRLPLLTYDLGRNRALIMNALGTTNEILFIGETGGLGGELTDMVPLRNYSDDGHTSLADAQAIIAAITGKPIAAAPDEDEECDFCDGTGWCEGGKVIKTVCEGKGTVSTGAIISTDKLTEYQLEIRTRLREKFKYKDLQIEIGRGDRLVVNGKVITGGVMVNDSRNRKDYENDVKFFSDEIRLQYLDRVDIPVLIVESGEI